MTMNRRKYILTLGTYVKVKRQKILDFFYNTENRLRFNPIFKFYKSLKIRVANIANNLTYNLDTKLQSLAQTIIERSDYFLRSLVRLFSIFYSRDRNRSTVNNIVNLQSRLQSVYREECSRSIVETIVRILRRLQWVYCGDYSTSIVETILRLQSRLTSVYSLG